MTAIMSVFVVDVDGCQHDANAHDQAGAQRLAAWCHARNLCYRTAGEPGHETIPGGGSVQWHEEWSGWSAPTCKCGHVFGITSVYAWGVDELQTHTARCQLDRPAFVQPDLFEFLGV